MADDGAAGRLALALFCEQIGEHALASPRRQILINQPHGEDRFCGWNSSSLANAEGINVISASPAANGAVGKLNFRIR
ncbi:hypothetical protein ACIQ9Q_40455 [Streptomyces sp. NPDC094438]|uniref:hypothetical protein n=1 Tax=Streptomyces sp. NPDC094438 TaxID=3366061 RepID=UPI00380DA905